MSFERIIVNYLIKRVEAHIIMNSIDRFIIEGTRNNIDDVLKRQGEIVGALINETDPKIIKKLRDCYIQWSNVLIDYSKTLNRYLKQVEVQ